MSVSISASFSRVPSKLASGWPNCRRVLAYSSASSNAARAIPSACAPTPIRPLSRALIATRKPSPSAPSWFSIGTRHVLEDELRRVGGAQAHLVLVLGDREARRIRRSTRNAVIPLWPEQQVGIGSREDQEDPGLRGVGDPELRAVEDPVVAVAQRLQRAGRPRRCRCPASERQKAPISPAARRGRKRLFCSSVPKDEDREARRPSCGPRR